MPQEETQVALGRAVRERRDELGMTQEALAEKAKLHVTWISRVENGHVNPGWATFKVLSRALKLRPSELAEREEKLDRKSRRRRAS